MPVPDRTRSPKRDLSGLDLSRWTLEPLREGDDLILYRARSRIPHSPLLVLAPVAGITDERSLARLKREYELASELEPAWAICPLALCRHEGSLVLVLEDCGGSLLSCLIAHPLGLQSFLQIAIRLAVAVGQVHQHGLIHKDLKPRFFVA